MPCCRENNSSRGEVDRSHIIGLGSFKRVYKGTYKDGKRKGQANATKELVETTPYTSTAFDHDVAIAKRASEIVETWNASKFIDKKILVNIPQVWVYTSESSLPGVTHLVEPFIENFEKFNSNTGWNPANQRRWTELMQALSHFSYHVSKRSILLCDLQGAVYRDGAILTDPAIHSNDRRYGPTDMGKKGMSTFFHHHTCNQFCLPEWRVPPTTAEEFPVRYGTSMVRADGVWLMPSRESKPCLPSAAGTARSAGDSGKAWKDTLTSGLPWLRSSRGGAKGTAGSGHRCRLSAVEETSDSAQSSTHVSAGAQSATLSSVAS